MIPVQDLPSTFDCPADEGGDPVLQTLINARAHYAISPSRSVYVGYGGRNVCAVGACIAEDDTPRASELTSKLVKGMLRHEQYLKVTTVEAIRLLEHEARRRHRIRSMFPTKWCGHLERINQQGDQTTPEILSIYDTVIKRRQAENALC